MTHNIMPNGTKIEAALVTSITKKGIHHECTVVDKYGYHVLVATRPNDVTMLVKAMRGTKRGETLVDVTVVDGKYISKASNTILPQCTHGVHGGCDTECGCNHKCFIHLCGVQCLACACSCFDSGK